MLDAIDRQTRAGCRGYALLLTLLNTEARVWELIDLRPMDLQLERPLQLRLYGKRDARNAFARCSRKLLRYCVCFFPNRDSQLA
ncbi:hypothetical protein SAMN05661010_02111 [Modicisalibacter muralis]|uniref:Uncharacterized protein n=1 Tax=Modicisalibacter muralis TaxID=119000 RepID=A0A1G9LJ18_9GAMM|nr:hypothetical protein SAMN05661010_02111 [Halomonas muralis]